MANFLEWYFSIPTITRIWLASTTYLSLLGHFKLTHPYVMFLDWKLFYYNFEIWRPLTALYYYPIASHSLFDWLLLLQFLYKYSNNFESDYFLGRPADFVFMLLFNLICCTIACFAAEIHYLSEPMVLSVIYVWCQFNRDDIESFFDLQIKSIYLPWVIVALDIILRGFGIHKLFGIFVGHLYYFLAYQYAHDFGGSVIIGFPEFIDNVDWDNRSLRDDPYRERFRRIPGFRHVHLRQIPDDKNNRGGDGGYAWGRGRRLGGYPRHL